MTRGSGSDRSQVGRNRCERPKPVTQAASRWRKEGSRLPGALLGLCAFTHTPAPVRWAPELPLLLKVGLLEFGCRAMRYTRPCSPPPAAVRPAPLWRFNADCNVRWGCRQFYEPRRYMLINNHIAPPHPPDFGPIRDFLNCIKRLKATKRYSNRWLRLLLLFFF